MSWAVRSCARASRRRRWRRSHSPYTRWARGQLGHRPALPQVRDGLLVEGLGGVVGGEQRPGPGEQPERQRGAGRGRPLGEPTERGLGKAGLAAACGGLDHVGQHVSAEVGAIVLIDGERALQRRPVVAQAELEHCQAILDPDVLCAAASIDHLARDRRRDPAGVHLATAPGELVQL